MQIPTARTEEPSDVQHPTWEFFNPTCTHATLSILRARILRSTKGANPTLVVWEAIADRSARSAVSQEIDQLTLRLRDEPQKRVAGRRLDMLGSQYPTIPIPADRRRHTRT
jgi:hypothetical protein